MRTAISRSFAQVFMCSSLVFAASASAQSGSLSLGDASSGLPSVSFIGSGCAVDSGAAVHWEGGALVISFGKMIAEKGQGISLLESRKNCAITLDLKVPKGLSYSLAAYAVTGYDDLADKDTRSFTLSNFFQGQSQSGTSSENKVGPLADAFHSYQFVKEDAAVWSPCGVQRAQTINAALRIGSGGGDRQSSSASTLSSLRLVFRIKACSPLPR